MPEGQTAGLAAGQSNGHAAGHDRRTVLELTVGPNGTCPPDRSAGWIPMSEAAAALGTTTRTLRRKVAAGELESILIGQPGAQVRWVRLVSEGQPADTSHGQAGGQAGGQTAGQPADRTGGRPTVTSGGRPADRLSPSAAGGDVHNCAHAVGRGQHAEEKLALVTAERDRLVEELERIHSQLDARTQAEAELRKLLAMSQHALQCSLERPALAAVSPVETPRRVRWWSPWRR